MTTHPREPALEAAVVANADEDTPRLVYADWLDEHGDPLRAEFIRVQCRLASGSPADPGWVEWVERENELLSAVHVHTRQTFPAPPLQVSDTWTPYQQDQTTQRYFRGFPFFCRVPFRTWTDTTTAQFVEQLAALVATTTVRGIAFHSISPVRVTKLAEHPAFGALRGLDLSLGLVGVDREEHERAWEALAQSSVSRHLNQFAIQSHFSAIMMRAMTTSQAFRELRRLEIPDTRDAFSLPAWLGGAWAQGLRHVCTKSPTGVTLIAEALGPLPELHSLVIGNVLGPELNALAAGAFPKLASLTLRGNGLSIEGFRTLLAAKWFEQIRALRLSDLGDQALAALAKHPVAQKLRGLWFGQNQIGKNGLRAFTRPGAFPELVSLDLTDCIGRQKSAPQEEVLRFVSGLALPQLKWLTLDRWPLGDAGARALATNPGLTGLTRLNLRDCHIGEAAQKALTESPHVGLAVRFRAS